MSPPSVMILSRHIGNRKDFEEMGKVPKVTDRFIKMHRKKHKSSIGTLSALWVLSCAIGLVPVGVPNFC